LVIVNRFGRRLPAFVRGREHKNMNKKLLEWQAAGLLSGEQVAAIDSFENKGPAGLSWGFRAILALGGFAIALGVIALVASNWDDISATIKFSGYFLIYAAALIAILRRPQSFLNYAYVIFWALYFFAGLGLISQVYQTSSPAYVPVFMWCGVTLPFFISWNRPLGWHLWLLGLQGGLLAYAEARDINWYVLVTVVPILMFAAARVVREVLAKALFVWGTAGLIVLAAFHDFSGGYATTGDVADFYRGLSFWHWQMVYLSVVCLVLSGLAGVKKNRMAAILMCVLAVLQVILFNFHLLASGASELQRQVWGAGLNLAVLFVLANDAALREHKRTFQTITILVALRFLVVYFQVFGSLAFTGLGLIFSGFVMLGLAYAWSRAKVSLSQWFERLAGKPTDDKVLLPAAFWQQAEYILQHKIYRALALVLPLLLLALLIVQKATAFIGAPTVRLQIHGYDPRDLIAGHYLAFTVDYGVTQPIELRYGSAYLCFTEEGGLKASAWHEGKAADSRDPQTCPVFLQGAMDYGRFLAGVEYYYVNENAALELDKALRSGEHKSEIILQINSEGQGRVQSLIFDDKPYGRVEP